jgi:hypothetical protein
MMEKPEAWKEVQKTIKEWMDLKIIRLLDPRTEDVEDGYYTPFVLVFKEEQETTKLRICLDFSRKYGQQKKSLNDAVLAGPKLQNSMLRILLLFRLNPFAISADVSKMFLSVGIAEQDQKWHRIHIDGNDYQFNNWPFGNAAGPFAALFTMARLAKNLGKSELTKGIIENCLYMDDVLASVKTKQEAIKVYEELIEVYDQALLLFRKWCTNDAVILARIPVEHRSKGFDFNDDSLNVATQLKGATVWWHGPHWLVEEEHMWPWLVNERNPDELRSFDEAIDKLSFTPDVCPKPAKKKIESITLNVCTDNNESLILGGEDDWPHWAKDQKIMCHKMINEKHDIKLDLSKKWNVVVDLVVAQQKPRIKWTGRSGWRKTLDKAVTYTLDQRWQAVKAVVKMEQQKHYGDEMIKAFKHGGWCGTELKNIAASFDMEGLLRAHARIDLSVGFHVQETRPIVLPRKSEMTRRIVQWRGIIRHCFEYQCLNNKPGRQKMGELPKESVAYDRLEPFRHVSMDFAGPFKVRVKTILCKHYLLVIVCRQLRAVHLEATGSLDTGDLILALLRFVARRRCPTTIRTDNGGSFESGRAEVLDPDQKALEARLSRKIPSRSTSATLPPTLESGKTTTTARVDQDVARLGQLIADEIGPTTQGRRKLLEACEADEVDRQVQHEAIQSAALAQLREEEQRSASE